MCDVRRSVLIGCFAVLIGCFDVRRSVLCCVVMRANTGVTTLLLFLAFFLSFDHRYPSWMTTLSLICEKMDPSLVR